jgi:hypothetical protein
MFIGIPHFVDKARRFTFMNAPSQDEKMVDRRACGGPWASIRSEYEEEQRRARGLLQAPVAYKNSEVIHSSNKPTNQPEWVSVTSIPQVPVITVIAKLPQKEKAH